MKKKIQGTRSNFFHFSTSNQVCMPVFFQLDISFDPQFKQKNVEKARIYYLFLFFGLFGGFSLREGPKIDGLPHILGLLNQKSITLSNPFRWVILVLPYLWGRCPKRLTLCLGRSSNEKTAQKFHKGNAFQMDHPTNRLTNIAGYKVACLRLKRFNLWVYENAGLW